MNKNITGDSNWADFRDTFNLCGDNFNSAVEIFFNQYRNFYESIPDENKDCIDETMQMLFSRLKEVGEIFRIKEI